MLKGFAVNSVGLSVLLLKVAVAVPLHLHLIIDLHIHHLQQPDRDFAPSTAIVRCATRFDIAAPTGAERRRAETTPLRCSPLPLHFARDMRAYLVWSRTGQVRCAEKLPAIGTTMLNCASFLGRGQGKTSHRTWTQSCVISSRLVPGGGKSTSQAQRSV